MKSITHPNQPQKDPKGHCRTITAVCLATLVFVGLGWALVATDTDNEAEALSPSTTAPTTTIHTPTAQSGTARWDAGAVGAYTLTPSGACGHFIASPESSLVKWYWRASTLCYSMSTYILTEGYTEEQLEQIRRAARAGRIPGFTNSIPAGYIGSLWVIHGAPTVTLPQGTSLTLSFADTTLSCTMNYNSLISERANSLYYNPWYYTRGLRVIYFSGGCWTDSFEVTSARVSTPLPTLTDTPSGRITPMSATGCTDGTFVDTTANPRVAGANNDLVEDCLALVAAQNHWAADPSNNTSGLASAFYHPLRTWGKTSTQKINTWKGITVSSNRVTSVNLSNSNRTSNFISGTIPPQLGNLSALTRLDLGGNRLTGSIPAQLGQLSRLTTLRLHSNRLTGTIPTQLAQLTKLTSLYLNNNRLTGTIPTQLAQLTKLKWVKLNINHLTGTIPTQLAQLSDLRQLSVDRNQLTGTIPTGLANLEHFSILGICQNNLTGALPTGLQTGVRLIDYPTSRGYNPVACQRIRSGSIPRLSATDCSNGTFVDTTANPRVTGANNDLVEDCQALVAVRNHWAANTSNDNLPTHHRLRIWGTGTSANQKINNWRGITIASKRVTAINLSNTHRYTRNSDFISGTIPAQIGNLSALTKLDLGNNRLTGSIPAQLAQLSRLTILRLYLNRLTGTIPTQLGQLANLTSIYLNYNQLSGNIPTQLGQLTNLKWLKLNQNNLTGNIPSQLGQLTKLNLLSLHYNRLSGNIPTQLGQLTKLTHLYLNNNQLTGSIPSGLGNLANLTTLGICQNNLTGTVPTGLRTGVRLTNYPTVEGYNTVACQRSTCQTGYSLYLSGGRGGCFPCPATTTSQTVPTGCARHTRIIPTTTTTTTTTAAPTTTTAAPTTTAATTPTPTTTLLSDSDINESEYANCLKNADTPVYVVISGFTGCQNCLNAVNYRKMSEYNTNKNPNYAEYFALGCPNYCENATGAARVICDASSGRIEAAIDSLVDKIYGLQCNIIYGRVVPLLMATKYREMFDDVNQLLKDSFAAEVDDAMSASVEGGVEGFASNLCPSIMEKFTQWTIDVNNWWRSKQND